jgi:hypothetical protein
MRQRWTDETSGASFNFQIRRFNSPKDPNENDKRDIIYMCMCWWAMVLRTMDKRRHMTQLTMTPLSSVLGATAAAAAAAATTADPYSAHWAMYPRSYTVQRAPPGFSVDSVDGDLTKNAWKSIPFSDAFGDIQGSKDAQNPPEHTIALTQFKALYDDTHLYIAAMLYPSHEFATQAHFTQRNSPIFQLDSDFEVFIDVHGSTHDYKELEVNALNTVWNLRLDKPYSDQGHEHSGRIAQPGEPDFYEVYQQKTAVRVLHGKLNDDAPNPVGALWSVEMALAYSDLYNNSNKAPTPYPIPPRPRPTAGDFWRINFSRVELKGEVNWTWQPQIIWDTQARDFKGKIDMHLPDAWGYLVFADAADADSEDNQHRDDDDDDDDDALVLRRDASWPLRLTAMNIYYAQRAYRERHGRYACCLSQLEHEKLVDPNIVGPFTVTLASQEEDDDDMDKDKKDSIIDSFVAKIQGKQQDEDTVEKLTTRTATTTLTTEAAELNVNDDGVDNNNNNNNNNRPLYATITQERLLQVFWISTSSSNGSHGFSGGEAQTTL